MVAKMWSSIEKQQYSNEKSHKGSWNRIFPYDSFWNTTYCNLGITVANFTMANVLCPLIENSIALKASTTLTKCSKDFSRLTYIFVKIQSITKLLILPDFTNRS